jgi:hypothetical protein
MKRFFLLTPLTFSVLLLSGCPYAKLPTPTPKVPEPKAQTTTLYGLPEITALNWNFDRVPASRRS